MGSQENAIPILSERGGKLELDREAIRRVFTNPKLRGRKICLISISGAYREGKSFMLNFFLRYLRNQGWSNSMWMGENGTIINHDGFTCKGGRNPVTIGIVIHKEIFTVYKDGEEIAILLIDTQGLFDGRMDNVKNTTVFALSTLLSSVQIFNISQRIKYSDLEYLELFTGYARAVKEPDSTHKPFQALSFLVRDWRHSSELSFGLDGGRKYLDEVLANRNALSNSVMSYLRESFETTDCCLLPYPGDNVAETDSSRCIKLVDVENNFLEITKEFAHQILKPENLVVKCINGQPIHTTAIMTLLEGSMENLSSGNLPTVDSMMESMAKAQNLEAQQKSVEKFQKGFSDLFTDDTFYDDAVLQEIHHKLHAASVEYYLELTRFGGEKTRSKYHQSLLTSLQRGHQDAMTRNTAIRAAAKLKVSRLVQIMTDEYESTFKNHQNDTVNQYSEGKDLEPLHETISSKLFDKFRMDKLASQFPESITELKKRIEDIFKKFKNDNAEAKRLAQEEDSKRKSLLQKQMELVSDFRKKISQMAPEYTEAHKLKELFDNEQRHALDMYDLALSQHDVARDDPALKCERFVGRIQREREWFTQKNEEKKKLLLTILESQYKNIQKQYDQSINRILEDGWMDEKDLRDSHNEIEAELIRHHEKEFNLHQLSPHMLREHRQKLLAIFKTKYAETKKRNLENYSYFGHFFKILKNRSDIIDIVRNVVGFALFTYMFKQKPPV